VSNGLTEEDPQGPAADARICTPSDVAAQYTQHHEDLHKVAKRFFEGKRPDVAENAVMDVFLRLSKLAEQQKLTDKGEGWGPYLRRAVRNSCTDIVRKEKKERERFPEGDPEQPPTIDADPLGDAVVANVQARRNIARLRPALAKLTENELAIIRHKAALKLVLEPIFEADFVPVSYGFRPRRRAHDAIAEIHLFGTQGYRWVLDADIEACFDSIDHTALMDRVRDRVKDKRVLALVKAFLKAGVLTEDGNRQETHTGTPQGGILSPLLANIALSVLDEHLHEPWRPGGVDVHRVSA